MKEGKKKTTAKKNMSSAKKAAPKTEPPKVKKVEVNEINKDFEDVENEDRRLIVFIAIAILVIVGTVIGLLVGCEKKDKNNPEPNKPNTDVVVPEKPDEKGNKDDGVRTREIVRKVRSVYHAKKKNSGGSGKKTVTTYNVTFYLGEDSQTEEVEKGKTSEAYVPTGYSECKYYKDAELTEEYDITGTITENVNVYMSCTAIEYSVVYESSDETVEIATTNPTTYMVTDGDVSLTDPVLNVVSTEQTTDETVTDVFFGGWYTASGEKTTTLNKNVVTTAGDDNVIHITAMITNEEPVVDEEVTDEPLEAEPMQMAKERTEEELEEVETLEPTEEVEVLDPLEIEEEVVFEETDETVEIEVQETEEELVLEETETEVPEEEVVLEPTEVVVEEIEATEEAVETLEPTEEVEVPTKEVVAEPTVVETEVPEVVEEVKETTAEVEPVIVVEEVKEEKVTEVKEEAKETPAPEVPEVPAEVVAPIKKEEPTKKVVEEKTPEVEKVEEEKVTETPEVEE